MSWQKIRYKKFLLRHRTGTRSRKRKDKAVSFLENDSKKFSSSLSCQSSETKPSTKLVLVSREPLLYLEFNKPNKQNVMRLVYLKNSTFLSLKITVDTLMLGMKHQNFSLGGSMQFFLDYTSHFNWRFTNLPLMLSM